MLILGVPVLSDDGLLLLHDDDLPVDLPLVDEAERPKHPPNIDVAGGEEVGADVDNIQGVIIALSSMLATFKPFSSSRMFCSQVWGKNP